MQRQTHTGGHHLRLEAETGRMGLQAKGTEGGRQSEAGGGGRILPRSPHGRQPLLTPGLWILVSRAVRRYISAVLSQDTCALIQWWAGRRVSPCGGTETGPSDRTHPAQAARALADFT